MMMITKNEALEELRRRYYQVGDPLYMCGITKIKQHYGNLITVEEIRNFLAKSKAYTKHYKFKPVKYNPYYIRRLRQMIQADLTDISNISKYNSNFKMMLCCIDCFSRKVWVRLLKQKTAKEVLSKMKSIIGETGKFDCLHTDKGTEFFNKDMKKFLNEQGIKHTTPYSSDHAPHIERLQLSLQDLIYKHITSTMNFRFIDDLEKIVHTYNSRRHRSTGLSPNQGELKENAEHIRLMHEKYYSSIKPTKKIRFKIGDYVRIARLKPHFGRGYEKQAPEAIYKVTEVIKKFPRVMYKLSTWDGKEKVIGNLYQEQLTLILDQNEFPIEKILKKRGKKILVKFEGYDLPEWISEKDVTPIKADS